MKDQNADKEKATGRVLANKIWIRTNEGAASGTSGLS